MQCGIGASVHTNGKSHFYAVSARPDLGTIMMHTLSLGPVLDARAPLSSMP